MIKKIIVSIITFFIVFGIATSASAQHHVKSGDTMSKIAKTYNMTLKDLISLNPHIANPNNIQLNDYIIIRSKTEPQKDLVDYARSLQYVTVYRYGGQNFPNEIDCSGWAQGIFKKFGVDLPRVSRDQAKTGKPVKFEDLQIGDLMFFSTTPDKTITHTGIYMGNDYWISNLNERKNVEIMSTWNSWTQKYFLWGARHEI
jgi:cell wall-associated NlpC family hydrolase